MSNGFGTEFLEELKSRANIVRVIQKYVPLERKGRNFWGRCPFHHEKTPSFAVNEENQFYHCFGCSASGDVIKFVIEMESVDFMDAVRILCEDCGMKMPELSHNLGEIEMEKKLKDRLHRLLKETANFYYRCLHADFGKEAKDYLLNRGVKESLMREFGLGYAPDYESSIRHLQEKGYTAEELKLAGVAGSDKGRLFDFLGERLIFPIQNAFADVIAFGGRVMVKTDFAKYKNTQETKLFVKSKNLYALNILKSVKQEKGLESCIMVEGYMDTIALHQAGFKNTVASMGTSLTKDQARLLKRYTDRVYICYDGDAAGQKATIRGLDILGVEGINVRVISIPDGLDPDELIQERGTDAFRMCIEQSLPLVDFKLLTLKKQFDIKGTEGRRKYTIEALKVISEIKNSTEQEDCLKLLRTETGFTLESLQRDLISVKEQDFQAVISAPPPENTDIDPNVKAIRVMLYCLLKSLRPLDGLTDLLPHIKLSYHRQIADYLKECSDKNTKPVPSLIYEFVEESGVDEIVRVLSSGDSFASEEQLTKFYDDSMRGFEKADLEEKIADVSSRFQKETDISERNKLTVILSELMAKLSILKKKK